MNPVPNEVFIDPKEKERLIKLLTEADEILNHYPYSSDTAPHTVTTMSRAKSNVKFAKEWVGYLHTSDTAK